MGYNTGFIIIYYNIYYYIIILVQYIILYKQYRKLCKIVVYNTYNSNNSYEIRIQCIIYSDSSGYNFYNNGNKGSIILYYI